MFKLYHCFHKIVLYTYFIGIEDLEVISIFTSLALLAIEPLFYVLFPIILIGEIIFAYSAIKGTGKWAMILSYIALLFFIAMIALFVSILF